MNNKYFFIRNGKPTTNPSGNVVDDNFKKTFTKENIKIREYELRYRLERNKLKCSDCGGTLIKYNDWLKCESCGLIIS